MDKGARRAVTGQPLLARYNSTRRPPRPRRPATSSTQRLPSPQRLRLQSPPPPSSHSGARGARRVVDSTCDLPTMVKATTATSAAVALLGLAAVAPARWAEADGAALRFASLRGYFVQDEPSTDADGFDYVRLGACGGPRQLPQRQVVRLTGRGAGGLQPGPHQPHLPDRRRGSGRGRGRGRRRADAVAPLPSLGRLSQRQPLRWRPRPLQGAGHGPPRPGLAQRGRVLLRDAGVERAPLLSAPLPLVSACRLLSLPAASPNSQLTDCGGSATGPSSTATAP